MADSSDYLSRLEVGSLFAGYRIDGLVARGGMGVVYQATDVDLDRTVALKIIAPEHVQNQDAVARFKSEARLAASLEHPNIVPIHRGGEFESVLYLAMRLVPGTNLREIINRGPLPVERAARIITQVAEALDAAHEGGLVHRDVKPANILVAGEEKNEHVYLTDFGLTKQLGSGGRLTQTGAWVGTPDYVAPEQIQGGSVDGRTDVYSLGCVLYEMLTGTVAFPRENDVAKLWAHVSDSPDPPSVTRPELVRPFDEIVARATAKNPDQRYAKPTELAAAVQSAVSQQSQASGQVAPPPDELQETRLGAPEAASAGAAGAAAAAASTGHEVFVEDPTYASGAQQPGPPPPAAPPPAGDQQPGGGPGPGPGADGPERRSGRRWPLVAGIAALLAIGIVAVAVIAGSGGDSDKKAAAPLPLKLAAVPTNRVTGSGSADVRLKGDLATIAIRTKGLLDRAPHAMHIHAGEKGQCPPASAARIHNGNRAISTTDGGSFYGHARAALTTRGDTTANSILAFDRYPADGNISYNRTFRLTPKAARAIRANNAVMIIHGIDYNRNGIQDGTLDRSELNPEVQGETTAPALCGPVVARGAKAQAPGGEGVYTAALGVHGAGPRWLCAL